MTSAFPTLPEHRRARAMAARHIGAELDTFNERARQAELLIRLAVSAALHMTGCDGADDRHTADNYLCDLFADVFGERRAEIMRRLDEEGGSP